MFKKMKARISNVHSKMKTTYAKSKKLNTFFSDRLTILLMVLIVAFTITSVTVFAAGSKSGSSDADDGSDDTMYKYSMTLAAALSDQVHTCSGTTSLNEAWNKYITSPAQAANYIGAPYLGVLNVDSGSNIWGSDSKIGNAGHTLSVTTFLPLCYDTKFSTITSGTDATTNDATVADAKSASDNAFIQYIVFGSALKQIGFDQTSTANGTEDGLHTIFGYLTYIFYILAYTSGKLITNVVSILQHIDIIHYIDQTLDPTNALDINATITAVDGTKTPVDVSKGLIDSDFILALSGIYKTIKKWRYLVMALLILFFVASVTVFKSHSYNAQAEKWKKGKTLFYRIIIMFIGVPLVSMVFHEGIKMLEGFDETNRYAASALVMAEYLDFEAFATTSGEEFNLKNIDMYVGYVGNVRPSSFGYLASSGILPSGYNKLGKLNDGYGTTYVSFNVDGEEVDNLNSVVFKINANSYAGGATANAKFDVYADGVADVASTYDTTAFGYNLKPFLDTKAGVTTSSGTSIDVTDADSALYSYCRSLLLRYARNTYISPSITYSSANYDIKTLKNKLAAAHGSTDDTYMAENNSVIESMAANLTSAEAVDNHFWSYIPDTVVGDVFVENNTDDSGVFKYILGQDDNDKDITISIDGAAGVCTYNVNVFGGGTDYSRLYLSSASSSGVLFEKMLGSRRVNNQWMECDGLATTLQAGDKDGNNYDNWGGAFKYHGEGGMSALGLYNYLNSDFDHGTVTVFSGGKTTNSAVGVRHYSVTTPYLGMTGIIQQIYFSALMISMGAVGWIFAVSMLVNVIVEFIKLIPTMFKMMIGSVQGFVEGLLLVLGIVIEIWVTCLIYYLSVSFIQFLITFIGKILTVIFAFMGSNMNISSGSSIFVSGSDVGLSVANICATLVILWGTMKLIKFRKAIIISVKSMITHLLNTAFGTHAKMPTGYNGGALGAAGVLGAAAIAGHALNSDGGLEDIANDFAGSKDKLEGAADSLKDGISDAIEDIKDGNFDDAKDDLAEGLSGAKDEFFDRGENADDAAAKELAENGDSINDNNTNLNNLNGDGHTDDQQDEIDGWYSSAADDAEKADEYEKAGNDEMADRYRRGSQAKFKAATDAQEKADIENFGSKERADAYRNGTLDQYDAEHNGGEGVEGDDITGVNGGGADIDGAEDYQGTSAPGGGTDGVGSTTFGTQTSGNHKSTSKIMQDLAQKYDANGLTEDQATAVDKAVSDGASQKEIANMIDGFASDNLGEDYQNTLSNINDAAGRSGQVTTYGTLSNDGENGRTMTVVSGHNSNGDYGYTVASIDEGSGDYAAGSNGVTMIGGSGPASDTQVYAEGHSGGQAPKRTVIGNVNQYDSGDYGTFAPPAGGGGGGPTTVNYDVGGGQGDVTYNYNQTGGNMTPPPMSSGFNNGGNYSGGNYGGGNYGVGGGFDGGNYDGGGYGAGGGFGGGSGFGYNDASTFGLHTKSDSNSVDPLKAALAFKVTTDALSNLTNNVTQPQVSEDNPDIPTDV